MAKQFSIIERWGVVSLLIVGCIYLYLNYFRDAIIDEHKALVKKNNEIVKAINETVPPDNIESIEARVSKLQNEVNVLKKKYNEVKALRLADESREEEMVLRINEMAANNGLHVNQLAPYTEDSKKTSSLFASVQTEQKAMERILYTVNLTGSFTSVYEFFSELRSLPSVVNVTNVRIMRNKDAEDVSVKLLFII